MNYAPSVPVFELCNVAPILSRQFKSPMPLVLCPFETMKIESLECLPLYFIDEFLEGVLNVSINLIF